MKKRKAAPVTPTPEQEAVSRLQLKRGEIALIKAYAGSGKSTSLRLLAEANAGLRIKYVVFNKAMADAAAATFPRNVDCRTSHSIAFESHGKQYLNRVGPIRPKDVARFLKLDTYESVEVIKALEHWFHSTDRDIDEKHVCADDDVSCDLTLNGLNDIWKEMKDPGSGLPMPHDGYQKLWSLSSPACADSDLLMVDEAQDLNPVVVDYALRTAVKCGVPVVFVGDPHQSIYSWRGATDGMVSVEKLATHKLQLTHSFRFGQKIAGNASTILNRLKFDPVEIIGAGAKPLPSDGVQSCILSRTNFSLIERALYELAEEPAMRFHFAATTKREKWSPRLPYKFQDLLDVLCIFLENFDQVQSHYFKKFTSWKEIIDFVEAGDDELKFLMKIVLAYGESLPKALSNLETASQGPDIADLNFSSAHRAKGLEWDLVELLGDFVSPFELEKTLQSPETDAGTRRKAQEEANLLYVAATRARHSVNFPDGIRRWLLRPSSDG